MSKPKAAAAAGQCESCGDWNGGGISKLCVDCKRRKPVLVRCQFPDCGVLFNKKGSSSKYCLVHRCIPTHSSTPGKPPGPPPTDPPKT